MHLPGEFVKARGSRFQIVAHLIGVLGKQFHQGDGDAFNNIPRAVYAHVKVRIGAVQVAAFLVVRRFVRLILIIKLRVVKRQRHCGPA